MQVDRAFRRLTPIATKPTSTLIAEQIRERVADGTFEAGSQLTEISLAEAFNVSRGPVREALQRLVQEGLLRNERNRGIFVPALTRADIEDIYRVRSCIEFTALEMLMKNQDEKLLAELDGILDKLKDAVARGNNTRVSELDLRFHQRLVQGSGSPRLDRAFGTLVVETRMCLSALEFAYRQHPDMDEWHRAMVDAVRRKDSRGARRAIARHNATVLQDLAFDPAG